MKIVVFLFILGRRQHSARMLCSPTALTQQSRSASAPREKEKRRKQKKKRRRRKKKQKQEKEEKKKKQTLYIQTPDQPPHGGVNVSSSS